MQSTRYYLPLITLLLVVGCTEMESVLEVKGSMTQIASFEFDWDNGPRVAHYVPAALVEQGVILTDYARGRAAPGTRLRDLEGKTIRDYGKVLDDDYFEGVRALAVSHDGDYLAVGAYFNGLVSQAVVIFDINSGAHVAGPFISSASEGKIKAVAFDREGARLAVTYDEEVAIFEVDGSGSPTARLIPSVAFLPVEVESIDFSPSNPDRLVSPAGVWSIDSGGIIRRFYGPEYDLKATLYNESGDRVVAVGKNGLTLIDAETGRVVSDPFGAVENDNASVARTVDFRHIVTGDDAGVVTVWDLKSGEIVARRKSSEYVRGVVCSTVDPNTFLTVGRDSVVVWRFER